jgi:hypothetical protein
MELLRQLVLAAEILRVVRQAKESGAVDAPLRGIRVDRETWDLRVTGSRRKPEGGARA